MCFFHCLVVSIPYSATSSGPILYPPPTSILFFRFSLDDILVFRVAIRVRGNAKKVVHIGNLPSLPFPPRSLSLDHRTRNDRRPSPHVLLLSTCHASSLHGGHKGGSCRSVLSPSADGASRLLRSHSVRVSAKAIRILLLRHRHRLCHPASGVGGRHTPTLSRHSVCMVPELPHATAMGWRSMAHRYRSRSSTLVGHLGDDAAAFRCLAFSQSGFGDY